MPAHPEPIVDDGLGVVGGNVPLTAAIDLGQDVLAAIVFSDARTPILVSGKLAKSINQHANKQSASIRSKHDRERDRIHAKNVIAAKRSGLSEPVYPHPIPSQRLDRVWSKRNDRMLWFLHTVSQRVVSALVDAGVVEVVVGWNMGFKSEINLGRRNNQKFVQIPHARFRDQLVWKASLAGIRVRVVEESYTSKASFLDADHIPTWGLGDAVGWRASGRRVKRGLFESATGILIHADVQAAYNILAKHVIRVHPTRVVSDTGVVVHPVWLKLPLGVDVHKP